MKRRAVFMRLTLAAVAASSAMTWLTASPGATLAAPAGQESAHRSFHDGHEPKRDPVTALLCQVNSSDPKCSPGH